MVEQLWFEEARHLKQKMKRFKELIWGWNEEIFGNIFIRKKRCLSRIMGVQRKLEQYATKSMEKLEGKLVDELNTILTQEESYWRKKAWAKWVADGEHNTKYFDAPVVERHRRNPIQEL